MKYLGILASSYSIRGLGDEAAGLVIVACALLAGGFFLRQVIRALKKDAAEELERERHGKKIL
jgi:hypothetical protein